MAQPIVSAQPIRLSLLSSSFKSDEIEFQHVRHQLRHTKFLKIKVFYLGFSFGLRYAVEIDE
jgi:hypothetical protein